MFVRVWLVVLGLNKPNIFTDQYLLDVRLLGPMIPHGLMFQMAIDRGLSHRRIKMYKVPGGKHVEVDGNGQRVDWWHRNILAEIKNVPDRPPPFRRPTSLWEAGGPYSIDLPGDYPIHTMIRHRIAYEITSAQQFVALSPLE